MMCKTTIRPFLHWGNVGWHLPLLLGALVFFSLSALGQTVEPNPPKSTAADQTQIEDYLDRLIVSTAVAADAASVIEEANRFRTEASQRLKHGRRDEGRALLRQAAEVIAVAAPEGDEKRQDPLLGEYLTEITKELVALDTMKVAGDSFIDAEPSANNARVAAFINYFQRRGRSRLEIGRSRLASYRPMMAQVFREEGVPEWLISVGFVESTYNSRAHSPKEAHGIWQFIPATGDRYGLRRTAWTDERENPEKSTRAAARYLRDLHALFGDWQLALAAYNWGEGRVARLIRRTGIRDFWTMADRGLLPQETANYVPSVIAVSRLLLENANQFTEVNAVSQ